MSTAPLSPPRPPAPPYANEGPHALWHFSEEPDIRVFRPRRTPGGAREEALVWAIDTRHAPLFWFPRECPRGCAWITETTSEADRERFFGHTEGSRIHAVESAWLERIRGCRLYAYRQPEESFAPDAEVGGYWVSRAAVEPIERVEAGDLLALHAAAGIELRVTPSIWPWWAAVIRSTLEFSGCRLRNCAVPEPAWVRP
jgi:hypothetical protein